MALASPWGGPLDWRPQRMILPPTGVDPIAGSGLTPYFRKRRKSLVRCALGTASDGVCGRNISLPSASDAAAALPLAEFGPKPATQRELSGQISRAAHSSRYKDRPQM